MAIVAKAATELAPANAKPAPGVARDPHVRGQVAMHAIITGYKVAANLAATLGSTPDKIREELHRLAAEVAVKVEAYTFHD